VLHVAIAVAGVDEREAVVLVERAGIGVLLKDVQGHPVRAVPPDLVKQQRADALTADIRVTCS
jgi:hypothetical protein